MSARRRPSELASYSDLFERMPDSVFLLDPEEFKVLDVNMSCELLLGQTLEEVRGRPFADWVDPEAHLQLEKTFRMSKRRYHVLEATVKWNHTSLAPQTMALAICPLTLPDESEVLQIICKNVTETIETRLKAEAYLEELKRANEALQTMSVTDEMTQLFNYRHFKAALIREHDRCARYSQPYSIVFLDVDHFKHYNDLNGHPAGDRLLAELAKVIRRSCRSIDIPARYGGEEFTVLCPETRREGALVLAERIRSAVASHEFEFRETQPLRIVSVSVGISSFPEDGKDADDILTAADDRVYESKEAGRNRVSWRNPDIGSGL